MPLPAGGEAASSGSGSGFTYKGSVPHLFRQGLASVDPRYESTRQFHLLSQAIKCFNIDHEASLVVKRKAWQKRLSYGVSIIFPRSATTVSETRCSWT